MQSDRIAILQNEFTHFEDKPFQGDIHIGFSLSDNKYSMRSTNLMVYQDEPYQNEAYTSDMTITTQSIRITTEPTSAILS
jgi:hypothetical protein